VPGVKKQPGRTRRDKAEGTRRAIVRAARSEFEGAGYHATTMAAVARRAGVAVQTVYFVFNTKARLLGACIDDAVLGDDPRPPQESTWWAAAVAEPDARAALEAFTAGTMTVVARAAGMAEVARVAAQTDPETRRTHEQHERLRREGYARMVADVAAKGHLRADLDESGATDVMLTLLGPATFLAMTVDHGWSEERVAQWFVARVPELLLARG
jgi:AcrR family transcriptional regulator